MVHLLLPAQGPGVGVQRDDRVVLLAGPGIVVRGPIEHGPRHRVDCRAAPDRGTGGRVPGHAVGPASDALGRRQRVPSPAHLARGQADPDELAARRAAWVPTIRTGRGFFTAGDSHVDVPFEHERRAGDRGRLALPHPHGPQLAPGAGVERMHIFPRCHRRSPCHPRPPARRERTPRRSPQTRTPTASPRSGRPAHRFLPSPQPT